MDLEERVSRIEELLNCKYKTKTLKDILEKINELEKENEDLENKIQSESNKTKRKDLYIQKLNNESFIKHLKWVIQ